MSVRLGTISDIPLLLRYIEKFHGMSPFRSLSFDPKKTEVFLKSVIEGHLVDFVCLIALSDEEPIGFLVGAANQPVFSSERIATELGWFIDKESRGSRASMLIYAAYEDWARRVGCSGIQSAYIPGVSPELDKFYNKRGYVHVESSYFKDLK